MPNCFPSNFSSSPASACFSIPLVALILLFIFTHLKDRNLIMLTYISSLYRREWFFLFGATYIYFSVDWLIGIIFSIFLLVVMFLSVAAHCVRDVCWNIFSPHFLFSAMFFVVFLNFVHGSLQTFKSGWICSLFFRASEFPVLL